MIKKNKDSELSSDCWICGCEIAKNDRHEHPAHPEKMVCRKCLEKSERKTSNVS